MARLSMAVRLKRIDAAIEVMQHPEDFVAGWDMGTFGSQDMRFNDDEGDEYGYEKPTHCNTVACFAGNLSLTPKFRALGFRGYWDNGELQLGKNDHGPRDWGIGLMKVLGITWDESEALIAPGATELDSWYMQNREVNLASRDISPKQVVRRLQRLRARYQRISDAA